MRSANAEPAPRAKRLSRRVTLASAAAAAVGGVMAGLVAGTAAIGLLDAHDDALLLTAAARLAVEFEEEVEEERQQWGLASGERSPRALYERALLDELEDVDLPGGGARVDTLAGLLAGDATLPRPAEGQCMDAELGGAPIHACTVRTGVGTLTLTTTAYGAEAREELLAWSALLGVLVGALFGGLSSHRAAIWALAPLFALSARIRRVEPAKPEPAALEPPMKHAELEELRASVVELVVRLGEALASARGFAAEAAHELRTPLTTLVGELELLAEAASPEDAGALERARSKVAELVTLVQRLLILAQPDTLDPDGTDAVDLGDVLDAVLDALPVQGRARVRADVEDDVLVRGDAALLGSLLKNAVENALKFSGDEVRVGIRHVGPGASLEVVDSGAGIAPEELDHVFRPFYRTHAARTSGALGHGVGLALIAHVAKVHGGAATIECAPSGGTRLEVRLPSWAPTRADQALRRR